MQRRTLLGWMAALGIGRAQEPFPGAQAANLRALARVVLPSAVDAASAAEGFAQWVRGYRGGAEMDHGYGFTRLRTKPALPVASYVKQLAALGPEPSAEAVAAALEEVKVADLPRTPDGRHVASDLIAWYFRSSDANDLCYRAAIGRDKCRGLAGSEDPPKELR
ncbi:MAG TPA: hypothetical protein VKX45_16740 [Bryobacteraceae bacterium]|nr:hypothetical protein [Bryobacteraceae bacterium]